MRRKKSPILLSSDEFLKLVRCNARRISIVQQFEVYLSIVC